MSTQHDKLTAACTALLLAYARNDDGLGSVDWDDVDRAFILACGALPGVYKTLAANLRRAAELPAPGTVTGEAHE